MHLYSIFLSIYIFFLKWVFYLKTHFLLVEGDFFVGVFCSLREFKSELYKIHQYTFIILRFRFAIAQQSFIPCHCLHRQIVSSDGLQFSTFAASTIILSCLKNQIWLDKEVWVATYIFKYFRDISKRISWKHICYDDREKMFSAI